MSNVLSSFALLLVLVFTSEGALYGGYVARCKFNSRDGHDAVYLEQYSFNKVLLLEYNSTVGTVIGFTDKAIKHAENLNRDTVVMSHLKWKTRLCRSSVPRLYDLLNPVMPYVRVKSVKAASSEHPGILSCSVYNFYPKQIKVTWLRDGKKILSDVTSTDELPNGNWLYQVHSDLEYKPRPGEKLTCMVEHASFQQPKVYDWDPMPDPGRHKFAGKIGTAGLLVGLFLAVVGIIYYKKSRVQVPDLLLQPEPRTH